MTDAISRELHRLRSYIAERELTLVQVSELAGVAYSTAREALQAGANPRIDTVSRLAKIVPEDYVPVTTASDDKEARQ